jgi:heat shock protein HspQ
MTFDTFQVGDLVRYREQPYVGIVVKVHTGVKTTYTVSWISQGPYVKKGDTCEEGYYMEKVTHV